MNSRSDKVVYLVRHGESVDSAGSVFQSAGSPLSTKGRKQAAKIAQRALKLEFDALIASPLQRAKETAKTIAQRTGKTPDYSELFVERTKPGGINGKPYTDPQANALWRQWEASMSTPGMKVGSGENYDEILKRADKALEYLKNRPEKSLLVVTHGYFLRTLVARILLGEQITGNLFRSIQRVASMENTGLTVLRYKDAFEEDRCWRLWIYNDHAHLAD